MTELEILRRRRELVVLSAELQRATLVRRLERVQDHPLHSVLGFAKRAAKFTFAWRLAAIVAGRLALRRKGAQRRPKPSFVSRWSWVLRLVPVSRVFPVLKFLNR
ncbi:MAG TPA: hypothetical protein VN598_18825 [Usitatibacter sp.]|nr:hypothetical protein [Usitatibacter sp.]